MSHQCHACGAHAHAEVPLCEICFKQLPEPHQKMLWKERQRNGVCGACEPVVGDGNGQSERWMSMFNLAIAMLNFVDLQDCHGCDGPEQFSDGDKFCWKCGVQDPGKTYPIAIKLVNRHKML